MSIESPKLEQTIQKLIDEAPSSTQSGQQPTIDQQAYSEWATRVDLLLTELVQPKRELLEQHLKVIRGNTTAASPYTRDQTIDMLKGMRKAVDDGTLP